MSVQKLVSEAEKLLDKGKPQEAIAKLEQALKEEPLNQLVGTKLANIHIENRDSAAAARVYVTLANHLSEAGKSQIAVPIFKKALELIPNDMNLRLRFAQECEMVGKLGDAYLQGQIVLQHFLRRKRYFDAASLLPLLVRAQPRDEKLKLIWLEVMQYSQADQKLPHLLVALCGPPGLVSQEFSVGGEPTAVSDAVYDRLKRLVPFFPRDPKLAYSVAWTALKRGRKRDFFHFLRESLRREPDFTLSLLLFARTLAEDQKLNESLFVFKHLKERLTTDKSVDLLTLTQLVEAFVEKNGWINFSEGFGGAEALEAGGFLKLIRGENGEPAREEPAAEGAFEEVSNESPFPVKEREKMRMGLTVAPPAEIELSPPTVEVGGAQEMEIEFTSGASRATQQVPAALAAPAPPLPEPVLDEPAGASGLIAESIEFTSLIKNPAPEPAVAPAPMVAELPAAASSEPELELALAAFTPPPAKEPPPVAESAPAAKKYFNPFADSALAFPSETIASSPSAGEAEPPQNQLQGEKTQMLSPMELLQAGKVMHNPELARVETRADVPKPAAPGSSPGSVDEERAAAEATKWKDLRVDGQATNLFSPVEAVQAAASSRQPFTPTPVPPAPPPLPEVSSAQAEPEGTVLVARPAVAQPAVQPPPPPAPPPPAPEPEGPPAADATKWKNLKPEGSPTELFSPLEAVQATFDSRLPFTPTFKPVPAPEATPELEDEGGHTEMVPRSAQSMIVEQEIDLEQAPEEELPLERAGEPSPDANELLADAMVSDLPAEAHEDFALPHAALAQGDVDLGDDLLEGPTQIFIRPQGSDKTENLLRDIREELKENPRPERNVELLLKKAERYIAKRNYYLARKALRHAQALGADELRVRDRLRDIRKLEFPEALYNAISSDRPGRENTDEILSRLEEEFDLSSGAASQGSAEIAAIVGSRIEEIFQESDPRTILDFGVALHEMGLFRQAEGIFLRLVNEHPGMAFDAYYLAAQAKLGRSDYAGAASILRKLSEYAGKTEIEKIQVYYALGETLEKMRQPNRSKAFFRKVAELDSNYRNIRNKLED